MSEIEQLKKRINESGIDGIKTSQIHDDYEPIGHVMIRDLLDSGEYVSRKTPMHSWNSEWRIFLSGSEPY